MIRLSLRRWRIRSMQSTRSDVRGGTTKGENIMTRTGWEELLGKKPDMELEREFGISHTTIGRRRRALGIPACKKRKRKLKIDWSQYPEPGTMSDEKLARLIGCSVRTVWRRRHSNEVPKP
jgi:hypothetical protein